MKKKQSFKNIQETEQLSSLLDVGRALVSEHDSGTILDLILQKAIDITHSDGASIYLIDRSMQNDTYDETLVRKTNSQRLGFYKTIGRNKQISTFNISLGLDNNSIAGFVANTGHSLRIRDCYTIDTHEPYHFNPDFDKLSNYRTKSMLCVPIKTNKGKVLGVLQLINKVRPSRRKNDEKLDIQEGEKIPERLIAAYSSQDQNLVESFAAHAAVALENSKLTNDIEKLFESFVKASVTAIEARDPSTSGHSERVAILTVGMAECINHVSSGRFRNIKFTDDQLKELRYASLLHDFGKIGVRENVLLKAQKLYPHEMEAILLRIDTLKARQEANEWKNMALEIVDEYKNIQNYSPQEAYKQALMRLDQFNFQVENIKKAILQANESQILDKDFDIKKTLDAINALSFKLGQKVLSEREAALLSITRGSLSPEERKEIESHVVHTYEFLKQIAWTENLEHVAHIAHCHHEKLDGTGYPRGLKAEHIPLQARMMTISDIYDALTMQRSYKKAASPERAIDILYMESDDGKLDRDLIDLFREAQVFEKLKKINKNAA